MDNFTHSLAGWALGQAGLKSKSRKGLAALILGANMPDIDVVFGNVGWAPLETHRGFTHGLVGGVLLMPPLLAGLLWLLDRWQVKRGDQFDSGLPMRLGWLVALCYLGALTHPLLDLMTTYSVQLFSPVSTDWYHSDALFIIDVWLWTGLAAALWWSRRQEKRGQPHRRTMIAAIGATLVYIGANLGLTQAAYASIKRRDPAAQSIFASPPPAFWWRRDLIWGNAGRYRHASFDPLGGGLGPTTQLPADNLDHSLVRRALREDKSLRDYLRWSVMPVASVVVSKDACRATVELGDARYLDASGKSRISRSATLDLCGR